MATEARSPPALLDELSRQRESTEQTLAVSQSLCDLWQLQIDAARLRESPDVPACELRSTVERIALLSASLSQ
jgi:hypothetical protein